MLWVSFLPSLVFDPYRIFVTEFRLTVLGKTGHVLRDLELLSDHSAPPSSFLPYLYQSLSAVTPKLRKSSSFSADRRCDCMTWNKTVEKSNYKFKVISIFLQWACVNKSPKPFSINSWKYIVLLVQTVTFSTGCGLSFCNISLEPVCVLNTSKSILIFLAVFGEEDKGFGYNYRKEEHLYPEDCQFLFFLCSAQEGCL